jgi:hypothetical protein
MIHSLFAYTVRDLCDVNERDRGAGVVGGSDTLVVRKLGGRVHQYGTVTAPVSDPDTS